MGDEAFGHHLVDVLRAEGVDVRGMRFDEQARTTIAFIAMPDENTAEFVFYRNPGADTRLCVDELEQELLQEGRAFHFGSVSLSEEPARSATLEAVRVARNAGALISFDANYRPTLWRSLEEAIEHVEAVVPQVNLLKVNEVELELLTGSDDLDASSKVLLERGPDVCVVTLGPDGSFFQVPEGGEHVPAFSVDTVDATGCGDAFVAGLLCQLVAAEDWRGQLTRDRLRRILRYANAVGALTSLKKGVIPALPTAAEVHDFLARTV